MIDWAAFVLVFAAALLGSCVVVAFYALGTRLLAVAGRALFVEPVEFTDAITVLTPEKAAKLQRKRLALTGAYACFTACGLAVLYGLYLIIPYFHQ
jgi:hypothetical protein